MKNEFSTSWNSSIQKRKQHKYNYNAPYHLKHKFLSANLSKALRDKYGKRNLPLRTGDEVLVMRGSFNKKKAKITSVNLRNTVVFLEGIQRQKKDGTKVAVPFHPSNLQIQTLNLDDKKRSDLLKVKESSSEKKEVKENKEVKKPVTKPKAKAN